MKKTTLFLVVFLFVFGFFIPNINNADAQTTIVSGCLSGYKYSPTTGQPCNNPAKIICAPGEKYSVETGALCTNVPTTPFPAVPPISTVPPISNPLVKFSYKQSGTEYYFSLSSEKLFDKVVVSPDSCMNKNIEIVSAYGKTDCRSFSANLKPTNGIEQKLTIVSKDSNTYESKVTAKVYYKGKFVGSNSTLVTVNPSDDSNPPVQVYPISITGVSGPVELDVGEKGKWTVRASADSRGGNLSYSVIWGDEAPVAYPTASGVSIMRAVQQSATFTHTYTRDGTYYPTFTISNNYGNENTNLSVNVGSTISNPSITVLSPNGGTYYSSDALKVSWTPYKGDFDYYYVILGNNYAGVEINASPGSRVSKKSTSSKITDLDGIIKEIVANSGGKAADQIQNGYYVVVEPAKINPVNGYLEPLHIRAVSSTFTILDSGTATPTPSITVLSPKEGEVWKTGTKEKITWNSNIVGTVCSLYSGCTVPVYDVTLEGSELCSGNICTMGFPVYTIAKNVSSPLTWMVGKESNREQLIPDGFYIVRVCHSGTDTCNISNSRFKITSGTTINTPIEIITQWLPNAKVGTKYDFSPKATGGLIDPVWNDYVWSVSYGNLPPGLILAEGLTIAGTPTTAENYNFSLTATAGSQSASRKFTLTVDSADTTPNPTLLGDVDGDGSVTCADNQMILDAVVGNITLTAEQKTRADMNKNGRITAYDATLLLQKYKLSCPTTTTPVAGAVQGAEAFTFTQRLQRGSQGEEVMELQKVLSQIGYYSGAIDGKFGVKTQAAVVKFQIENYLDGDGVVGPEVRKFLHR